jgi:pimeloyl-ACP methyl ester carboxylesterase
MNAYRVERYDAQLRYHDLPGRDPTCVFLHGLGSASSSYFPWAAAHPRLRDHRSILIDFLGHGYSDRPEGFDYAMEGQAEIVVALLRSLEIEGCVLVGHSMGGSIAVLVATAAPNLIDRLVIAEGNLDPGPGVVSGPITSMTEEEFVAHGHGKFVDQIRGAGFSDYAGTLQVADPVALHRSAVSLIAERHPTYRECLARLHLPRTFLFGDENLPDPDVDLLLADGVKIRVIPQSGHDMMADNPDGFVEAVADAIEGRS